MKDPEFYKKIPRKRVGVGAILFNQDGQLLILKPSYKDTWTIPGGIVDTMESPLEACCREIKEEIGIEITDLRLACVDYRNDDVLDDGSKDESFQFIFTTDPLTLDLISSIVIDEDEIINHAFLGVTEAIQKLNKSLIRRINSCLRSDPNLAYYLENGLHVDQVKEK